MMPLLDRLRLDPKFMANVAAWEKIPSRSARYADFPKRLDSRLIEALNRRGISSLYTHQADSVEAALRGENLVVVTGTASGKTLCYNLPILQTCLHDSSARALYLFPTKALAQDQAAELSALTSNLQPQISIRIYDGDTSQNQRPAIRREAQLLITNPDMLHTGVLPHHTKWSELFANLRWVVLDELHTYRGVFGSHVANVIRRLKRICKFYGSDPQFICASATIANPKELAEKLLEAPVTLVSNDGSPRAEKHFILYNPPLIDPALGLRRSYTLESKEIAAQFIGDGVQTVVFGRARATVEVLLGYVRDAAEKFQIDPKAIRGYRGGYLPNERREIERGLRDGSVRGVVATNALELGVDIGQLGAAVIAGYPGSIASLWQQAGRAGRRSETSAVAFVASAAPLDQYIALHPRYIFESSPEHALINPDNLAILLSHVRCAAFELPFEEGETFGEAGEALLEILEESGEVHESGGTATWVGDSYPAEAVSLRTSGDDRVVIQDVTDGKPVVIGEVDSVRAPIHVHTGAVYLHEGRQYLVAELKWDERIATVTATEADYYTQASESATLEVLDVTDADERGPARKAHGTALVTSQASGYRKVKRYTHETVGFGEIDLPPREFQTTAYWLWIAPEIAEQLMDEGVLLRPNDYGPNWEAQRNAARARDNFRCQQCNAVEPRDGPQHHVHHLRPFREFGYVRGENENYKLANELDNLMTLCPSCHRQVESANRAKSALGGLAHALGNLAPLYLMCDPRDLSNLVESKSKETGGPTITFYDGVPEGIGLSGRLYELHDELLRGALELVRDCPCSDGCPACIGPVGADGGESKALTVRLVDALMR
ncbi:MAG: DEAD/DEAH box helicase [Chloroflexi bacterium]|nr:DEAD/DEAH box helicase [Chloroflexota bacterium]